jgi:hypothetical protein
LCPVDASLPIEIAEHFASWMTLSSMIQPLAQFGPDQAGLVGGRRGPRAGRLASSKPRTVL